MDLGQERIVLLIAVALFALFSVTLNGFFTTDNLLSLVQSVSILGILGVGIALTIIGRGIDLSIVATMAMGTGWMFLMQQGGMSPLASFAIVLAAVILIGVINGVLIAYAEIPAIFATLAMGTVIYGFFRLFLVPGDVIYLPPDGGLLTQIGSLRVLGIPGSVVMFGVVSAVAAILLRYTVPGRYIYAIGDNPLTARASGLPVRPLIVVQYVLSSVTALVAGIVMASAVSSVNTRIVSSTLVYDVILVVVLGGVGLSGGKGRISNVIVGTILIGILLNGMVIVDLAYTTQNMIKGGILLVAIIVDSVINPRDEQTSQQGDI